MKRAGSKRESSGSELVRAASCGCPARASAAVQGGPPEGGGRPRPRSAPWPNSSLWTDYGQAGRQLVESNSILGSAETTMQVTVRIVAIAALSLGAADLFLGQTSTPSPLPATDEIYACPM